jgi:bisanhydrobacterioruberin hydratase
MRLFRYVSLSLFLVYLAVFPGSTIVVALDRVPGWGGWMGGALLLLQGASASSWLIDYAGRRGALAGALVFLLAWAVEHIGVTTGFPFGRYRYTDMLGPQLLGVVPLAIAFAWVMVAVGAWQLATNDQRQRAKDQDALPALVVRPSSLVVAATLVLLLDLQIETVATKINRYWVWLDAGPYYGVPTANFVAWWLVGLGMAIVVAAILSTANRRTTNDERQRIGARFEARFTLHTSRIPTYLYLLSTLMFTVANLARGHELAGLVGVGVLLVVALRALRPLDRSPFQPQRTPTRQGD